MITYRQLRTFLAVARTGSLTKAARELNASQPTVSLQLIALRRTLEAELIDRAGKGFRLTPAGEKLRGYAEQALGGLRTLQQDIAAFEGSLAGTLIVGATFVMSRYVLPAALSRFRVQFPRVDVHLHVEVPEPLLASLLANDSDVGCLIAVRTPPGLAIEPLCVEEFVIVASPQHPLTGRRRVSPEELSRYPFVAPVSKPLKDLLEARLRGAGVTPRVAAEGRHHDGIKELVERNAGYSILIRASVADELASGRLVALRLDGPPLLAEIVAIYRSGQRVSPLVRKFIEFIGADLRQSRQAGGAPGRLIRAVRPNGRRRASRMPASDDRPSAKGKSAGSSRSRR